MDLSKKLAISYYKTIATINESHKVYLVQHQDTHKIYVKKILDVYNIRVYTFLFHNPIPGIPRIIDFYEENNQLTLIEEYISGCSLQEKIHSGVLTLPDVLKYLTDICNILEQLHSLNPPIIHRDIKPSNLIVTNYNHIVLLDFNAAKQFYSGASCDTILLGTQGYAAPEQYGFASSTPQTDIYSVGIVLREMISILKQPPKYLSAIADKCTQMNPSERYRSASELKRDIASHMRPSSKISAQSHSAKYAPPGYRTGPPWKMQLAPACYLFILWLCLSMEISNVTTPVLWLERFFFLAMTLSVIFGCFNYLDMQKLLPLCKPPNRLVHYLGIVLLDFMVVFLLLVLLMILESVFFSP